MSGRVGSNQTGSQQIVGNNGVSQAGVAALSPFLLYSKRKYVFPRSQLIKLGKGLLPIKLAVPNPHPVLPQGHSPEGGCLSSLPSWRQRNMSATPGLARKYVLCLSRLKGVALLGAFALLAHSCLLQWRYHKWFVPQFQHDEGAYELCPWRAEFAGANTSGPHGVATYRQSLVFLLRLC